MIKRSILLFYFLLLLYGCHSPVAPTKKPIQILRTCLGFDVVSLDPRKGVNMTSQAVVRMLFTGLVRLDDQMVPQMELAESYKASNDYKTYTFTLKKCLWSDGSPITAYDFEKTWKAALTPAYSSPNTNLFFHIKNGRQIFLGQASADQFGAKALDDRTLEIELEKPNPNFLDVLINSIFSPVHPSMQHSLPNESRLICSGPFCLKNRVFQDQIILEKNSYYWNSAQVNLQEIHYYIIKDAGTALLMFEGKELDWMGEPLIRILPDSIPHYKSTGLLHSCPAAGNQWMFLNTDKPPLNNPHIRKALAYAIDREKIMRDVLHVDDYQPSLGLIPKILKRERWHPWFPDHDYAKAREAFQKGLQELGITADQFPPLTILAAISYKAIQAIQQMWQEQLGIQVNIEIIDGTILVSRSSARQFDIVWMGWILQYHDPVNMLEIFKSRNIQPNYSGWENQDFIRYTDACYSAKTDQERWNTVESAEAIFCREMPSIPVNDFISFYLQQPYVKGVHMNPLLQIDFDRATIER